MPGTVEGAFAAALYADPAVDDGRGLDTGASLLAADPAADTELRRRGAEFLRRAWERGWQPADVVRIVRRDLDEPHTRLVAELIATEAVRYERVAPAGAPSSRRSRPTSKPTAGAAPRPGPPTASPPRPPPWSCTGCSYDCRMIEAVGPVPGTPVHLPAADGEPRMLTRIRALLAKAEGTDFPEEAEALSAKAQELMARHSIDEALLADRAHSADVPAAWRIGVDAPYESAKAILLDAVASANRCQAVWNSGFGFSTVVGFEPDLEVVELLYTSLLVQGTGAMTRAEAAQRASGRKRTKTFRQSFLMAYAHRIGERLAATAEQATAEQVAADAARAASGEPVGTKAGDPALTAAWGRAVAARPGGTRHGGHRSRGADVPRNGADEGARCDRRRRVGARQGGGRPGARHLLIKRAPGSGNPAPLSRESGLRQGAGMPVGSSSGSLPGSVLARLSFVPPSHESTSVFPSLESIDPIVRSVFPSAHLSDSIGSPPMSSTAPWQMCSSAMRAALPSLTDSATALPSVIPAQLPSRLSAVVVASGVASSPPASCDALGAGAPLLLSLPESSPLSPPPQPPRVSATTSPAAATPLRASLCMYLSPFSSTTAPSYQDGRRELRRRVPDEYRKHWHRKGFPFVSTNEAIRSQACSQGNTPVHVHLLMHWHVNTAMIRAS